MEDSGPQDLSKRIREIFDAVSDLPDIDRQSYLDLNLDPGRYESDGVVRREVERLLAFQDRSGILDRTLIKTDNATDFAAPALEPSELVANRFRVIRMIGSGGMGEVYEAFDLTVERTVALKTIRADMARDANQIERFRRELVISRDLAHRNVCKVFHYDEIDRTSKNRLRFFTMELLQGETLAQRIERLGRLTSDSALRILQQVAAGLDEVHRRGIIHRDLKPANIFLVKETNGEERAVVMDFGLARNLSESEARQTRTGMVMGTRLYMPPELSQAANVSADVYSFGVIALEMVTGSPSPLVPPRSVVRSLDPVWDKAVLSCFTIDPAKRPASPLAVVAMLRKRTRRWLKPAIAAGLLFLVAVVGAGTWAYAGSTSGTAATTQITHDAGIARDPSTSADGRLLAYSSDSNSPGDLNIWLKNMETGELNQITNDPGDEVEPSLSPDGATIAWRSNREDTIYLRMVAGGEARVLSKNAYAPRFSPDGKCIAWWTGKESDVTGAHVWVAPVSQSAPSANRETGGCGSGRRELADPFADARMPGWSPDSKSVLFYGVRSGPLQNDAGHDLWIAPLDGGSIQPTGIIPRLGQDNRIHESSLLWQGGTWARPSRVIFAATLGQGHGINLFSVSLFPFRRTAMGAPHQITTGGRLQFVPAALAGGRIAYADLEERINIYRLNPATSLHEWTPREDTQITTGDSIETCVSASSDGKILVFGRKLGKFRYSWMADRRGGGVKETQLTFDDSLTVPFVSPDGTTAAISAELKDGSTEIRLVNLAFPARIARKFPHCGKLRGWLPDNREVLYISAAAGAKTSLIALDTATGNKRTLLSERGLHEGVVSPDGRALAFTVNDGDTSVLRISALSDAGAVWPPIDLTSDLGRADKMAWSSDSKTLYFTSMSDGAQCIWKREVDTQRLGLRAVAKPVLHLHKARFSMHPLNPDSASIAFGGGDLFFSASVGASNIWAVQP